MPSGSLSPAKDDNGRIDIALLSVSAVWATMGTSTQTLFLSNTTIATFSRSIVWWHCDYFTTEFTAKIFEPLAEKIPRRISDTLG